MKGTGIFVTDEELKMVKDAINAPIEIWYMASGVPMRLRYRTDRSPQEAVADLFRKYNPPAGSKLNPKTGEFCTR